MTDERDLREAIGLADACELLASVSIFPNDILADALFDGRLAGDARSCLEDCGIDPDEAAVICEPWERLVGKDRDTTLAHLRRTHSLLFVRQGDGVAVWPYESAFLHAEAGKDGEPALFRSAVTLDVEKMMREAGGLPQDARTEPCDSVWDEFMFLSYLFGSEADALNADDEEAMELFRGRSKAFVEEHASRWLPSFFDAVDREISGMGEVEKTEGSEGFGSLEDASLLFYKGLCSYGVHVMEVMSRRIA